MSRQQLADWFDPVDPACPLVGEHHVNVGKIFHAYGPSNSGWTGGNTVRDIVRGLRPPQDGTRTNAPSWVMTPYGVGMKYVSASSQYVDHGELVAFKGISRYTMAAWMMRASGLVSAVCVNGTGRREGFTHYSDNNIYFLVNTGGTYGFCALGNTSWYRVHMVFDGSLSGNAKLAAYINGAVQTLSYSGTLPTTSGSGGNLQTGRDAAVALSDSMIADVCIWDRAFSAQEVRAEYQESRLGYPNAFNRLSRRAWFVDTPLFTQNPYILDQIPDRRPCKVVAY